MHRPLALRPAASRRPLALETLERRTLLAADGVSPLLDDFGAAPDRAEELPAEESWETLEGDGWEDSWFEEAAPDEAATEVVTDSEAPAEPAEEPPTTESSELWLTAAPKQLSAADEEPLAYEVESEEFAEPLEADLLTDVEKSGDDATESETLGDVTPDAPPPEFIQRQLESEAELETETELETQVELESETLLEAELTLTDAADDDAQPEVLAQNSPSPASPEPFDVDGNGVVTGLDAVLIANQLLLGAAGEEASAIASYELDVNGDGVIDEGDFEAVVALLDEQFAAESESTAPADAFAPVLAEEGLDRTAEDLSEADEPADEEWNEDESAASSRLSEDALLEWGEFLMGLFEDALTDDDFSAETVDETTDDAVLAG